MAAVGPQADVTSVSVLDRRTGLTWTYRGDALVYTGSVSKVLIVAQALRQVRAARRSLTATQRYWAKAAITRSDNAGASNLYALIGGHAGVATLARDLGMSATAQAPPAGHWGATATTSLDLVTMMRRLTDGSPVTHSDDDAYLLGLMSQIVLNQRWGVGTVRSATVATRHKNGWMAVEAPRWVINSVGDVRGNGRDYVLAVLMRRQVEQEPSMIRCSRISRAVFQALGQPLR